MAVSKVLFEKLYTILTLLTMGLFFEAAHGLRGPKRLPSLKCLPYPTMMTLGAVISYQRKSKKISKSCDTPLEFCWHQHFFH